MSEREEFKAWLKTWALPGNTSREDAMYAAWQERAARTASAEQVYPVAWMNFDGEGNYDFTNDHETAMDWQKSNGEKYKNWLKPLYTAPDALQAEVERLSNALEVEKRSAENEVKRRNQYAQESDELDRQVEALKADAERYQYLKYILDDSPYYIQLLEHIEGDLLDEAIDNSRRDHPDFKPEVKS